MKLVAFVLAPLVTLLGIAGDAHATPDIEACLDGYDRGQALRDEHKLLVDHLASARRAARPSPFATLTF